MLKKLNPHKVYLTIILILVLGISISSGKLSVSNNSGVFSINIIYDDAVAIAESIEH